MPKSIYIHLSWALVACIAFIIGVKNAGDSSDSDQGDIEAAGGNPYSRAVRAEQRREAGTRAASRVRQAGAGASRAAGSDADLGDGEIKALGNVLKTSNDPIERRMAFAQLLRGLTLENAELLREQLSHMSSQNSEWRDFHYAWGRLGGQAVVEFGKESDQRDLAAVFSGWASADPRAALDWLSQQDASEQNRRDLKLGVAFGLANSDPALATEFISERFKLGDRDADNMIRMVADRMLLASGPEVAAKWSEGLPEGELRDDAVRRVADTYAQKNPVEAVAWLESLPEGKGQSRGIRSVFARWAGSDNTAAVNRLNAMEPSSSRDSAVRGYVSGIARKDPKTAIEWAGTITDEQARADALAHSGRAYMRQDREAATQWLNQSDLPEPVKRRIGGSKR